MLATQRFFTVGRTTPFLLLSRKQVRSSGPADIGSASPGEPQQASKTSAGPNQPHDQQKDNGADRRIDDLRNQAAADVNAKPWEKPAGDEGADNADNDVADDAKAGAAHDLAGQPARDQTDEQNDDKTFTRYVHKVPLMTRDVLLALLTNLAI